MASRKQVTIKPTPTRPITHKVIAGDDIAKLATFYGVSVGSIKRRNGLRRNQLKPGTVLEIK